MPEEPKHELVVACEWMSIQNYEISNCDELPTKRSPGNGKYYCAFHYQFGKDFGPMEKENK